MPGTTAHPSAAFLTRLPCPGSFSEVWQTVSPSQVLDVPPYAEHRVQKTVAGFKCVAASNSTVAATFKPNLGLGSWSRNKPVDEPGKQNNKERDLGPCPEDSLFLSQGHLRNMFLHTHTQNRDSEGEGTSGYKYLCANFEPICD